MHSHDNTLQMHELTYMIGQGNARSHLWKFSTWRFVCRGLLVNSNQILQACPLIFALSDWSFSHLPCWCSLWSTRSLFLHLTTAPEPPPTTPPTHYPPAYTDPGLLPQPQTGPPVTQRLASCIPRGHLPKAKGKMLTTSSPGQHLVAIRASAFTSWGARGERGAKGNRI